MNDKIYKNMSKHNELLSKYATKDDDAIYFKEIDKTLRTPFFQDIDKIIYSLSYLRYMNKTQVFINRKNDHIQSRMVHVQYVSKIARTIGRALNLNEDLIEAASLGHDLGHTPFGHEGEKILNKISLELDEGYFMHNINSARLLMYVEKYGKGENISLQVLDAIMCHNGEMVSNEYYPKPKTQEDFLNEYFNSYKSLDIANYLRPMTLEGCVVRVSDMIAYLGRDIEDGVRMKLLTFDDIPQNVKKVLGTTNSEIVNSIVCDIIEHSTNKAYISMSDSVYEAMKELKDFNYKNIYGKALILEEKEEIEKMFRVVVEKYLNDLNNKNYNSSIYSSFLNNMSLEYKDNTNERIVIDYVSGMTDDFIQEQYKNIIKSKN